jgi:Scramblase
MQSNAWKQAFQLPEIILKRDIELGDLLLGFEQSRQMSLNTIDDRMLLAVVEEPGGIFSGAIVRQIFESSRAFTFDVFALDRPEPQGELSVL